MATGPALGGSVVLRDEPSVEVARRDLQAGRVSVVLVGTKDVLVKTSLGSSTSSSTALLARAIASSVSLQAGLENSGIPPSQAALLAHPRPLPIAALHPARSQTQRTTTLYALILAFVLLTQYGTWILMGVVEEKSSRVIEVLLSTLRPVQLLTGKVVGIGMVALTQAVLIVGVALGLGAAVGSDLLRGSAPLIVADSLGWLLLGYVFYCWVYAAAGSLATRQEHLQTVAFPLQIPLLVGYITSLTTIGADSPSTFIKVLAYFPPTAPFDMPALVTLGRATWWQVAISAALTIAATIGVARLATAIYLRAILQTRQRVKVRDIWRSARFAGPLSNAAGTTRPPTRLR